MFRRYLELSADMVLTKLPQECPVFLRQQIIETDTRTDENFFYLRNRPQEQALFVRTGAVGHLFFACRVTEVCRRTADIVDIPLEIWFLGQKFCFLNN